MLHSHQVLITHGHSAMPYSPLPLTPPTLTGDPRTKIKGDLSHGAFIGMINTPEEQYHIEPASYHFPEGHPHHSIIYRSTDVDHTALKGTTCGLSHDETMESVMEAQGSRRQRRNAPLSAVRDCVCACV